MTCWTRWMTLAGRHAIAEFIIDFANAGATRLAALDLLARSPQARPSGQPPGLTVSLPVYPC